MLRRKNGFLWAQWKALGRKKEDRERDTEQGDEGEKSPLKETRTDKYVGDDRKVSK